MMIMVMTMQRTGTRWLLTNRFRRLGLRPGNTVRISGQSVPAGRNFSNNSPYQGAARIRDNPHGETNNPMDKEAVLALFNLTYPIGVGLAGIGAGLGLGKAVSGALEAISRQPEATPQIAQNMIIGCALIEALAIYALVTPFFV
jgi:F-type H+-transporting ATPase subunit c